MKTALIFCLTAASLVNGHLAHAQASVSSSLTAQRVELETGKTVMKPATVSKPGDVIAYTGTYRNSGTSVASKLVAIIPVPAGTTLVAGSAEPPKAQASTDGTRFSDMPLMRTVKLPNGTSRTEAVPLVEYRALRWEIGTLGPAATSEVGLRVRVDAPEAAVAGQTISVNTGKAAAKP